jgi:hypothetical protein
MQEMLTRWGFTTVWDLGSNLQNTLTIRTRMESGEVSRPADPNGRCHLSEERTSRISASRNAID